MSTRIVMVPVWERCPCCEDYWCNLHETHAFQCGCPPVDDWQADLDGRMPYDIKIPIFVDDNGDLL